MSEEGAAEGPTGGEQGSGTGELPGTPLGLLLEVSTIVAVPAAAIYYFSRGLFRAELDVLTPGMLLVVWAVWLVYTSTSAGWSGRRHQHQNDLQSEASIQASNTLLGRPAYRRLPVGRSDTIVEELAARGSAPWTPSGWLSTGQSVLISLGLIGTFLGLTVGLLGAVPKLQEAATMSATETVTSTARQDADVLMQEGMKDLLGGAELAFAKSLAGIWCGLLFGLRYRRMEAEHEEILNEVRIVLDHRYPPLHPEEVLLRMEAEQQAFRSEMLAALEQQTGVFRPLVDGEGTALRPALNYVARRMQTLVSLATGEETALRPALDQLADRLDRLLPLAEGEDTSVRAGLEEVTETLGQLADSLPEKVGQRSGAQIAAVLAPSFEQLQQALSRLSSAGGEAIGTALQQSMDGEVGQLRSSLNELAGLLQSLGPSIQSGLEQADSELRAGATSAALALSEAGEKSSADMTQAATGLRDQTLELQAAIASMRDALSDSTTLATELSTAAHSVSNELHQVAEPLARLTPTLDETVKQSGLVAASMKQGAVEARAIVEAEQAVASDLQSLLELQRTVQGGLGTLVGSVDALRGRLGATMDVLESSARDQRTASTTSATDLVGAVAAFREDLQAVRTEVAEASRLSLADARSTTAAAAQDLAKALTSSSERMEQSMQQLQALAETVQTALNAANTSAGALASQAEALRTDAEAVQRPFGQVAEALELVAPQVRQASAALETERRALEGVGGQLEAQSRRLTQSGESLEDHLEALQDVHSALEKEWATHIASVDQFLERLRKNWSQALEAADSGLEKNARKIANYAERVESSLRLPSDLRRLDGTVEELTDVLADLQATLEKKQS